MPGDRREYWLTLLFFLGFALRAEAQQGPIIVTPGSGGVIRFGDASAGQPGGRSDARPADSPSHDKEKAEKDKPTDKGKPDEKKDESGKPLQRPATPPKPANPDELKLRPGADGKLRFNFNGQPWPAVLEWLGDVSGTSIDWQELPSDYLNLVTQRSYTLEEARELINKHLLTRGYTLVAQGEMFSVMSLKKLDPAALPRVEPAELAKRSPYEVVKVCFPLAWLPAETAAEELKPMLGPHGKLSALPATNRIEAIDAVANLRQIWEVLGQEQSPDEQERLVREFGFRYARAGDVLEQLQMLLGIEQKGGASGSPGRSGGGPSPEQQMQQMQQQMQMMQQAQQGKGGPAASKPKSDVSLVVNRRRNSVLARAPADKMVVVEQAVKMLDVPSDQGQGLQATVSRMQVYRLAAIDPEPLVRTLEEVGNLDPSTRLQIDKANKSIVAYAPLADHVTIRSMIEKLDGSARRFEVVQLRRLQADYVAGTIDFMMTGKRDQSSQRSHWSNWSPWSGSRRDGDETPKQFGIDTDVENNRLLLWANDIEIAEIQKLLVKLGEIPGGEGNASTVRMINVPEGKETDEWLERIRRVWPSVAPNPLILPPADESAPANGPIPPRPPPRAPAEPRDPTDTKAKPTRSDRPAEPLPKAATPTADWLSVREPDLARQERRPAWDPYVRFAQLPGADAPKRAAEAPAKPPPVTVTRNRDGRLIVSSSDPRALDHLEEVMTQLEPPRIDYKIFQLKHAWASGVAAILRDVFKEDDKSKRRDPFFWDPYAGDDREPKTPLRLSKRKPLKILSDTDTNSILVQGADPSQLKKIGELIEYYDRAEPPDAKSIRKTEVITLHYAKAKTVAETIKDVYRDLLSVNDKALQSNHQHTDRSYTFVFDSGGDADQKTPKFKGLLSMGFDETSNTVIISAPMVLFEDVKRLVEELDRAAEPTSEQVQVVRLGNGTSGTEVRTAINRLFGDGKLPPKDLRHQPTGRATPPIGTSGSTSGTSNANRTSGSHSSGASQEGKATP